MDDTRRILNFWYNLEFFSPYWPESTKDTKYITKSNNRIPWITTDSRFAYEIYLGKINTQDLIVDMINAIGEQDDAIEKEHSNTCVCAFKLNHDGTYVASSFSISTFVWAVAKIIAKKDLNVELNNVEIEKTNAEMNELLASLNKKFEFDDIKKIYSTVLDKLLLKREYSTFSAVINKKNISKENENDDSNPNTGMIPSFYVSDIDMIRQHLQKGDRISNYISALNKSVSNRIEIDTDVSHMKKWLSPDKYPLGKWPSKYNPSLMQQIAINIGISDSESLCNIFSVNGPPGTGKTTLLKEIIASNIVERAILMSSYEHPDKAFVKCDFNSQENKHLKHYYQPLDELINYGVIVASNNNAAVENISKELPIAKDVKKSNTNLFDLDLNQESYFSDIANSLMGDDEACWGLISARLGKKTNIKELKQALWFNKSGVNLRKLYDEERPNWEEAKTSFKKKHEEVLKYRKLIRKAVRKTKSHQRVIQDLEIARVNTVDAKNQMIAQQDEINRTIEEQDRVKNEIETLETNRLLLASRLGKLKRMFSFLFKKDSIIKQLTNIRREIDVVTLKIVDINMEVSRLQMLINTLTDNYNILQEDLYNKEKIYLDSKELIETYKKQFGKNFADDEFWVNIQRNDESQIASPWTNEEYDKLREELFYYGLMLHKAFILNSNRVKQNMNCLVNMWSGSFTIKDKVASYTHLLNTLLLIVPVISTTFASVSTFLKHVNKEGIGMLIIDEAGQATPQSALGALWRTKKAIIVGDPLQVEPIISVPKELSKKFAKEFKLNASYRSQELSVQVLADSINMYGGYREYLNGEIWLGCPLIIHRRCVEPMFSISNEIAYNNRMFMKSSEPDKNVPLLMEKSVWLDVKGNENGNKDHFVPAQGEIVIKMVLNAFEVQNAFPNLYIISPFKTVTYQMRYLLEKKIRNQYPKFSPQDINEWLKKSCGTVHTFQGKEANEVILILGCDKKSGEGAAQWAGKKPNILNVAVTRAKYRVAIIGDSDLWRKVPNFDYVHKLLSSNEDENIS